MRIHIQMGLCFLTKYLHFVLVQAFVRTKLQLRRTIVEIHIANGMSDMFAPITRFSSFKRSSTTLWETGFGAVSGTFRSCQKFWWIERDWSFAPSAVCIWNCEDFLNLIRKEVKWRNCRCRQYTDEKKHWIVHSINYFQRSLFPVFQINFHIFSYRRDKLTFHIRILNDTAISGPLSIH